MRGLCKRIGLSAIDGFGAPFLIIFSPYFVHCVVCGDMKSFFTAFLGIWGQYLGWGIALFLIYLLISAYLKLEKEWGSREILWKIDDLTSMPNGRGYVLGGSVYNGGTSIKDVNIGLVDFESSNSNKVPDLRLIRGGASEKETDLHNGVKFEFWIAAVQRDTTPQPYKQIFFIPTCIIGETDGQQRNWPLAPGVYSFTLQLSGDQFKINRYRVKIEVFDSDRIDAINIISQKNTPWQICNFILHYRHEKENAWNT